MKKEHTKKYEIVITDDPHHEWLNHRYNIVVWVNGGRDIAGAKGTNKKEHIKDYIQNIIKAYEEAQKEIREEIVTKYYINKIEELRIK